MIRGPVRATIPLMKPSSQPRRHRRATLSGFSIVLASYPGLRDFSLALAVASPWANVGTSRWDCIIQPRRGVAKSAQGAANRAIATIRETLGMITNEDNPERVALTKLPQQCDFPSSRSSRTAFSCTSSCHTCCNQIYTRTVSCNTYTPRRSSPRSRVGG